MLTKVRPFHKIWRKSAEVWDDRYITNHLLCLLVTTWPASTTNFTTTMNGFPCRGFCGASGSPCLPSPPRPEVKAVTRPPAAPPLHWQSASHKPLRLNSWSRVVATPSKCPPQNGRNLPKRWEKNGFPGAGVQKILCASQQVGKNCVIFWGETKIQRIFQKTPRRKG